MKDLLLLLLLLWPPLLPLLLLLLLELLRLSRPADLNNHSLTPERIHQKLDLHSAHWETNCWKRFEVLCSSYLVRQPACEESQEEVEPVWEDARRWGPPEIVKEKPCH